MSNNENIQFKIGEEVHHSSGTGPAMSVTKISDDGNEITCRWFDKTQNLKTATFNKAELEKPSNEPVMRVGRILL